MFGCKSLSSLLFLAMVAACAPRSLTLLDFAADGGLASDSLDDSPADLFAYDVGLAPDSIDGNSVDASDAGTPADLLHGLIGLWHLDDDIGSKVASDSSGHGNDGNLVNLDPSQAWVPGRQGGGLATNGAGYVLVPDSASINGITAQVTVSAWVYLDGVISATDLYGTAISRQIGSTDEQYYHLSLFQGGFPSLFIGMSAKILPVHVVASQAVISRHWTHLAGTYDGSRAVLYVDGVEVGSQSISGVFPADTAALVLGGNGNKATTTELFPGSLDEIALYDRALSPEEIRLLANPQ